MGHLEWTETGPTRWHWNATPSLGDVQAGLSSGSSTNFILEKTDGIAQTPRKVNEEKYMKIDWFLYLH